MNEQKILFCLQNTLGSKVFLFKLNNNKLHFIQAYSNYVKYQKSVGKFSRTKPLNIGQILSQFKDSIWFVNQRSFLEHFLKFDEKNGCRKGFLIKISEKLSENPLFSQVVKYNIEERLKIDDLELAW